MLYLIPYVRKHTCNLYFAMHTFQIYVIIAPHIFWHQTNLHMRAFVEIFLIFFYSLCLVDPFEIVSLVAISMSKYAFYKINDSLSIAIDISHNSQCCQITNLRKYVLR